MSDIVCKDDGTVEIYYNSYYDPFEKQQYEGGVFSYNIGEGGKAFNDEYIPISQVKGMTDALAAFEIEHNYESGIYFGDIQKDARTLMIYDLGEDAVNELSQEKYDSIIGKYEEEALSSEYLGLYMVDDQRRAIDTVHDIQKGAVTVVNTATAVAAVVGNPVVSAGALFIAGLTNATDTYIDYSLGLEEDAYKGAAFMALDLVTMNSLPEAKLELAGIGAAEGEADDFIRALDKNIDNFDNFFKASDDIFDDGARVLHSAGSQSDEVVEAVARAENEAEEAVEAVAHSGNPERGAVHTDELTGSPKKINSTEASNHKESNLGESTGKKIDADDVHKSDVDAAEGKSGNRENSKTDAERKNHNDSDNHKNQNDAEEHGQHGEDEFDGYDTDEDDWDFNLEDDINDGILYGDELTNSLNSEPLEVETSASDVISEGEKSSITKSEYSSLRKKTPNADIRKMVNPEGPKIDPVYGYETSVLEADHIVSMKKVVEMPGFSQLSAEQKEEVLNLKDNFIGLGKPTNASKGAKSWTEWRGHSVLGEVPDSVRKEMLEKERKAKLALQKAIKEGLENDGY